MKVVHLAGINSKEDEVRGIGTHTSSLIRELKRLQSKDFEIVGVVKNADIVHYTKFHPFFISLPFFKPARKVILTIHDLIPLIYPEVYKPSIKGRLMFLVNKFLINKNVDAIVTISETSKKDICRFLGVDPKKVHVIYLGPKDLPRENVNFAKYHLPKKYALYVGDINYNKNIPNLIKACQKAKITLVMCGKQAKEIENMDLNHPELSHLKNLNFKNVIRLGFVPDEDLMSMYKNALMYIQPSFYEGFGLPLLEAFESGCPVIAAKTQALVEIGGEACLYFNPYKVEDIADKIKQIERNDALRKQLIENGKNTVKKYSWEKCAKETINLYSNV